MGNGGVSGHVSLLGGSVDAAGRIYCSDRIGFVADQYFAEDWQCLARIRCIFGIRYSVHFGDRIWSLPTQNPFSERKDLTLSFSWGVIPCLRMTIIWKTLAFPCDLVNDNRNA